MKEPYCKLILPTLTFLFSMTLGNGEYALFESLIVPLLKEGQVLIVMEGGYDKDLVVGWAAAYRSNGESYQIDIEEIYDRAAKAFGIPIKTINRVS